jgi:hypothetical protein
MSEKAFLRNQLGLEAFEYKEVDAFPGEQIDAIIAQSLDHNQSLREELVKRPNEPLDVVRSGKGREKQDLYRDVCTFWVPLRTEDSRRDQEFARMRLKQLPISIIKKPKSKGCTKCEKAISMMACCCVENTERQ